MSIIDDSDSVRDMYKLKLKDMTFKIKKIRGKEIIYGNYFKIKKRKIIFIFLLIFNQLILSSYAFNNRKIEISGSEESKFSKKYWRELKLLISSEKLNENNLLNQDVEELERFVEETFNSENIENLNNLQDYKPSINNQFNEIGEDLKIAILNRNQTKRKNFWPNHNKSNTSNKENLNQTKTNELLLPSRSIISTSEFKVPQEVM